MKTTKISVAILLTVLTSTLFGFVFTTFRSYDYLSRIKMPDVSVWYLSKSLSFGLVFAIGLGLFLLIRNYQRQGFFDKNSMKIVKIMGWVTIALAIPNSVFNVLKNVVDVRNNSHLDKLTPVSDWIGDFWIDIVSESNLYIILGMLILLFANFIQKAIAIKSENEAFV
jgi:hypothetical protein